MHSQMKFRYVHRLAVIDHKLSDIKKTQKKHRIDTWN
jgi:hypothetical protein